MKVLMMCQKTVYILHFHHAKVPVRPHKCLFICCLFVFLCRNELPDVLIYCGQRMIPVLSLIFSRTLVLFNSTQFNLALILWENTLENVLQQPFSMTKTRHWSLWQNVQDQYWNVDEGTFQKHDFLLVKGWEMCVDTISHIQEMMAPSDKRQLTVQIRIRLDNLINLSIH